MWDEIYRRIVASHLTKCLANSAWPTSQVKFTTNEVEINLPLCLYLRISLWSKSKNQTKRIMSVVTVINICVVFLKIRRNDRQTNILLRVAIEFP